MRLIDYLEQENLTVREFSKLFNMDYTTIYRVLNGHDMKLTTAECIQNATMGSVTFIDLLACINRRKKTKINLRRT